jgi:hypothetical protein
MPRAEIASKRAIFTLSQLHAELAGKFAENRNAGVKIKTAMMQVEAVLQMLQPTFDVRSISGKRRNKSNPWFKCGTLFRSAMDVLRRAEAPMTAREIADTLIAGKAPQATRKQAIELEAAIRVALRKRNGGTVTGIGAPARWVLNTGAGNGENLRHLVANPEFAT